MRNILNFHPEGYWYTTMYIINRMTSRFPEWREETLPTISADFLKRMSTWHIKCVSPISEMLTKTHKKPEFDHARFETEIPASSYPSHKAYHIALLTQASTELLEFYNTGISRETSIEIDSWFEAMVLVQRRFGTSSHRLTEKMKLHTIDFVDPSFRKDEGAHYPNFSHEVLLIYITHLVTINKGIEENDASDMGGITPWPKASSDVLDSLFLNKIPSALLSLYDPSIAETPNIHFAKMEIPYYEFTKATQRCEDSLPSIERLQMLVIQKVMEKVRESMMNSHDEDIEQAGVNGLAALLAHTTSVMSTAVVAEKKTEKVRRCFHKTKKRKRTSTTYKPRDPHEFNWDHSTMGCQSLLYQYANHLRQHQTPALGDLAGTIYE